MLSVIMPAYNAATYIGPAIESILKQTFADFELIVSDDGSTDRTREIVRRYAGADRRVRLIERGRIGQSRVRNEAIREARYGWIANMDADDVALPKRFERQMQAARANPKVVAWGTYVYHLSAQGEILSLSKTGPVTEREFEHRRSREMDINVYHPTALFRKEVFERVGGYAGLFQTSEDFDLFSRMAEVGPILTIPEPLLLYRIHQQSHSMQKFFLQRKERRLIIARTRARRRAQPPPVFEELERAELQQPWPRRAQVWLEDWGCYYYRRSGLSLGEKKYLDFLGSLMLSGLLSPKYVWWRLWTHKLSPEARHWLKHRADSLEAIPDLQTSERRDARLSGH
jgi:glycosyltransferase involved in cell wall biosynthesis